MLTVVENKKFPFENPTKGKEGTAMIIEPTSLFYVCQYMKNINKDILYLFQEGEIKYAIYELHTSYVFYSMILHKKIKNTIILVEGIVNSNTFRGEPLHNWLGSDSNLMTYCLVDANTNVLKATRIIKIDKQVTEKMKELCKKQFFFKMKDLVSEVQHFLTNRDPGLLRRLQWKDLK